MDAELFKKVVPYHCLGSIWSQRDKKGKEHLAPTIRATVTQFNSVANCVITTCLGDRSTKAPDRARVVEHWIEVARECRILKNFSSLYAILSALQSNSIHRLKKTWEDVSRDSFRIFQKLSEIFSDENNYSLSRELLIKEGTVQVCHPGDEPQESPETAKGDGHHPGHRSLPGHVPHRPGDAGHRHEGLPVWQTHQLREEEEGVRGDRPDQAAAVGLQQLQHHAR
ncbi:hypothetical protein H8959_012449 [Pygathrix nigripes]